MKTIQSFAALGLVLSAIACGGNTAKPLSPADSSGKKDRSGNMVAKKAAEGFNAAIDAFVAQDKSGTWTDALCKQIAGQFDAASAEQKSAAGVDLPEAAYNSGLAYQRCGDDANAKASFAKAVNIDKNFHRARAQLALYKFKESGNLDAAVADLDQIIRDAKFQNVEALVGLAALQMQRGGNASGPGCSNDLACAQLNLQRALAIDDSFMPAFNQLALYYMEQAKASADKGKGGKKGGLAVSGVKKAKVDKQRLDLAALVASQATKKNPNYAPMYNTSGLILVELENYNGAVQAFGKARQLNPKFFEAQMNYAAVNLSFRGFAEAEKAYREALKLRPNTYEAHLGLALALRGQIEGEAAERMLAEAQKELDAAKALDGKRAETYYNEAILAEEYKAKRSAEPIPAFEAAIKQYQEFIGKAGSDAAFADAVKRAKDRVQDIQDTITFMKETSAMDKAQKEDMERMKQAEEDQKKADAAAAAAAPPAAAGAPAAPPAAPPAK